jgi:hypothetical protein
VQDPNNDQSFVTIRNSLLGGKSDINFIYNRLNIKIYAIKVEFNLSSRNDNLLGGVNTFEIHYNKYEIDKNIIKEIFSCNKIHVL